MIQSKVITSSLIVCVTVLLFGGNTAYAQRIVIENGVEYKVDKEEIENDNSLSLELINAVKLSKAKLKRKKVKRVKRTLSKEDIETLENGHNGLRFRKKRKSNKCFEKKIESCKTKK